MRLSPTGGNFFAVVKPFDENTVKNSNVILKEIVFVKNPNRNVPKLTVILS